MGSRFKILIPGRIQWDYHDRLKSVFFFGFSIIFLITGILIPHLLDNPNERYELYFEFMSQSPTKASLFRFMGLWLFGLTLICSIADYFIWRSIPFMPDPSHKLLWKQVLSLWLSGEIKKAQEIINQSLEKSQDPWLYYLQARFLFLNKDYAQAKKNLNQSQFFDLNNELSNEQEKLNRQLQGDLT